MRQYTSLNIFPGTHSMKKVLILFAHPRYEKHGSTRPCLKAFTVRTALPSALPLRADPDFNVDTACEQELLLASDRASSHRQNDHAWQTGLVRQQRRESGLHPATGRAPLNCCGRRCPGRGEWAATPDGYSVDQELVEVVSVRKGHFSCFLRVLYEVALAS